MKVLIAGAGWAGLSCAIELTKAGHHATVLEASRAVGGRARSLNVTMPDGTEATLDNGQHILIGAYSETLRLMREVGVQPEKVLHRMPLTLRFPATSSAEGAKGDALQLPDWKKPLIKGIDVACGVMMAKGWSLLDKFSLLRTAASWRLGGFQCAPQTTVSELCKHVTERVMQMLIEPLCVSALNTPANRASGQVFLRIMHDSLFASTEGDANFTCGSSNLLLPKADLGTLFPQAAAVWLAQRGCEVRLGHRLTHITSDTNSLSNSEHSAHISCRGETGLIEKYDVVVLATPPVEAARIAKLSGHTAWAQAADALQHEAITTVYAQAKDAKLHCHMMALQSGQSEPAQFVFDRGALTGHTGLLAFVVSASQGDAATIEHQVIQQGRKQLSLPNLQPLQTITDKRATFACTPALQRPAAQISKGIVACGDYVDGPYPSTLEGAVRSGIAVAKLAQLSVDRRVE
jgi:hydroxysqualene dehydroxylase